MALPPTSSKISTDANEVTTFKFDFPNFTGTHIGTQLSLQVNAVAGGGTGLASLTAHNLLVGNGTSNLTLLAPGTTAYPLVSNGASLDPSYQQLSLTAGVTGILPAANGGAPPVTRNLYVDGNRTDSFTADGSLARPFATISAAISQIITNNDNASHPYTINVTPFAYAETLNFNSTSLVNISISSNLSASTPLQNISISGITSTSNNTQLANLELNGFAVNGNINLTGNVNGTNFGSTQILFSSCQFNDSAGTITLNNVNNVNFYNCQVQGSGAVATFTNIAFAYMNGSEGFIGGTTLHLVDNPGGNVPAQYSGNYLLFNQTKFYGTITIDAGSELDTLTSYFGSTSVVTNNGTIHSWATNWSSSSTAVTLNNGSTTRIRGDFFYLPPVVNSGATLTNQGEFMPSNLDFSQISTPSNPTSGHNKLYFKSDDKLYGLNSSGTETLLGPQLSGLTTDGVIYATSATVAASTAAGTTAYPLVSNGGGGSAPSFQQLSLTAGVTGVLPIANGGTDNGSLAVTAGGVIYTDGTKLQNVGAGISGQVLTSNGASAPTWQTTGGGTTGSYAQAYFAAGTGWGTSSTGAFVDPTFGGGSTSLIVRQSNGITLTAGGSNVPGITFTPASSSAVYLITAMCTIDNTTAGQGTAVRMTDGTTVITSNGQYDQGANIMVVQALTGIYVPGTTSPVTVKLQLYATGGSGEIQSGGGGNTSPLEWVVVRIS